jgi:D-arabinose 1-dehydrogenase-like Zn-dependent alcohol dehydrogenase
VAGSCRLWRSGTAGDQIRESYGWVNLNHVHPILTTVIIRRTELRVVALDISDTMLEMAKRNGADKILNPQSDPTFVKHIRKWTGKRGCHAAAVFSDSSAAYTTAQRALMFDGLLMVVGMPEKPLQFPAFAVSTNLFRVAGASNGRPEEMKKAVEFTRKHQIVPDVTFRKLEEMPQMWDELSSGKATTRMVVLFGESNSKL